MFSSDLWLEGKSMEMRRKSSGMGWGLNPACGASKQVLLLLKEIQEDSFLRPSRSAGHGSYSRYTVVYI